MSFELDTKRGSSGIHARLRRAAGGSEEPLLPPASPVVQLATGLRRSRNLSMMQTAHAHKAARCRIHTATSGNPNCWATSAAERITSAEYANRLLSSAAR